MKVLKIAAAVLILGASSASAAVFDIMIGDNDGYGFGLADNGVTTAADIGIFAADFRSAAEIAATNGAEQTDINSALFSPLSETANFIFSGFGGPVTSATLTIDIGGLQVSTFGETLASFNGVLQSGLLALDQGIFQTNVLSFVLDAAALANLNADGFFDLELDRNGNGDAIFIDYVSLSGEAQISPIPVPAAGFMLLGALGGLAAVRRRKHKVA